MWAWEGGGQQTVWLVSSESLHLCDFNGKELCTDGFKRFIVSKAIERMVCLFHSSHYQSAIWKKLQNTVHTGFVEGLLSTARQGSLVTVRILCKAGPRGSEAAELAALVLYNASWAARSTSIYTLRIYTLAVRTYTHAYRVHSKLIVLICV